MRRLAVPPNRVLIEGERICPLCGSGAQSHRDGSRGHPMPPPAWMNPGLAMPSTSAAPEICLVIAVLAVVFLLVVLS